MKHPLSRKDFLKAGGAAFLVTASVTGCDFLSTDPASNGGGQSQGAAKKGKEAPQLAERVKAGELPPVEERLPDEPMVVEPIERVGVYGGEWRTTLLGTADTSWLGRTVGYENLVRWRTDWTEVIPNLAESFEANAGGTEFTFRLRRGLKWSDGEPFTADDIVFAQNDVYNNKEIFPTVPDEPIRAEKVDDQTVRIILPDSEPDGLFLERQATGSGFALATKPFHYLKQFHKKYNPDVDRLVEEAGVEDWVTLFDNKAGATDGALFWQNPDIPTMHAWEVTQSLGEGNRMVLQRNPFYWKTDPEGSQLPYLDTVTYDILQDAEVMLTRALNGEIEMHSRHFNTLANKPVLAENRNRGNYNFFDNIQSEMNTAIIALNLCHKDNVKREIFNNKDFRIGLSHAINRPEIISVVYQEQGEPWQAAPRRDSNLFNERLAKQYTGYDADLANEHLDRAGYSERDPEGVRLGPDGNPISFAVEVATDFRPDIVDVMEQVQGYWQEVGIDVNVRNINRTLFYERKAANDHDANVWSGDNGLRDALLDPRWYFPSNNVESNHAIPWATWYIGNGEGGQEPPEAPKRQMELYDQIKATTDNAEQYRLMREILDIAQQEFAVMGINLSPPSFGIVKNNFHNVPKHAIFESAQYNNPAPSNPEQYFME